ncbi:YceI family protein [Levilinea saccharolytica]|uniref:Uncharacterized conserved protein n=1 Tax=Levilinea saccharolytica TaxID=229921 RepID=A0A0M8JQA6_9CHLR|nr:YceI family protein [Levilinea saccharolytica]KPL82233.1 hypothetical protein ADN01_09005 [Levilinea saccharolytica]GAP19449.1 uncharacterized conserved protein [Levilinea saccharolytica]
MGKKWILIAILVGLAAVTAVVILFLKPTQEASQPLAAVPIATATAAAPPTPAPTQPPAAAEPAAPAATQPPAAAPASGESLFEIDPARSEARFKINEVLNGSPKTVIGVTNQVAGQIAVDRGNYASTRLGEVRVNARTLTTDNEFRNRAVKNRILLTNDHEWIVFTPQSLTGLPAEVKLGEAFQFQITGDLTIIGKTQSVTFNAEVTAVSETELKGLAVATVRYKDFGIFIPEVPSVTGVEDDVILEIEFTAVPVP